MQIHKHQSMQGRTLYEVGHMRIFCYMKSRMVNTLFICPIRSEAWIRSLTQRPFILLLNLVLLHIIAAKHSTCFRKKYYRGKSSVKYTIAFFVDRSFKCRP